MTKEELKQEAEEIANKRCHEIMCFNHCSFSSPKHHRCGEWHREYNCAKNGIEYGLKSQEKRIADLEKENAELKKRIKTLEQIKREHIDYTIKVEEERTFVKDQLTKAKYLISKCIKLLKLYKKTNDLETVEQLENFLKDSEVEK